MAICSSTGTPLDRRAVALNGSAISASVIDRMRSELLRWLQRNSLFAQTDRG
jgi:hypothetical protein